MHWREKVATEKRAMYRQESYWGKPVPGFGDPEARIVIVGLAPAAHGANRTGRIFTGDRSGDFLFAALFRAGLASQPESRHRDDGLSLKGVYILSPVRCAPPENKPTPDELRTCAPLFDQELALLRKKKVWLALGKVAWDAVLRWEGASRRPAFGHGAVFELGERTLVGSYHVSQQNTQTGRLTPAMLDGALRECKRLAGVHS